MSESPLKINSVEFSKSGTRRSHFPKDELPQIAFVGRSNVGKSSLLNVLVNRKRLAHVSSTPGRTQLVNFFIVNQVLYFVDLPGYGFAKAPLSVKGAWEEMITGYLRDNQALRVVVALFDARRELTEEDGKLLDWLTHYNIPFIAVVTKCDKLSRSERAQAQQRYLKGLKTHSPVAIQMFSAQTREGKDELLALLGGMVLEDER